MRDEDALSMRYVRALVDAVEHRGVSRSCFLQAAHWDVQRLHAVEGRVPCSEFVRLSELALDVTGDAALGLHMFERVRADSVDLVGQLVAHAGTVREALQGLLRMHKLLGDERRFQLIDDGGDVTLRCECPRGLSPRARGFFAEFHLAGCHLLLRYFARQARPARVCFEHAAPAHRGEYARIFGGVERFEQPFTGIVFGQAWMGAARRYHDEEYHRTLRELADSRVLRIARGVRCADRVRDFLAAHEAPSKATMIAVAHALDMSPRSLRRRLAAEDTAYDAVFDDALASKAKRLLALEQRTIEETAHALGYSGASAFYRAFKRWTGTTPRAWRLSSE
jgi:AraC-like DNA-binding protein